MDHSGKDPDDKSTSSQKEGFKSFNAIDEDAVENLPPESKPKHVSIRKLLSMADNWDLLLILVGTIGALVRGTGSFISFFLFGKIFKSFGQSTSLQASLSSTKFLNELLEVAIVYAVLAVAFFMGGFLELSCYMYTAERQASKLRRRYMEAILTQEVGYFETDGNTAEISNNLTESIAEIQTAIGEKMGHGIAYLWATFASQTLGAYFCWQLALLALVIAPLVFTAGGLYQRAMFSISSKSKQAYGKADSIVEETVSQIRTVYSYVGEIRAVASFAEALKKCVKMGSQAGLTKGIGLGSMNITINLSWALMFYVGGVLISGGQVRAANAIITILCVVYGGLIFSFAAPDIEALAKARRLAYPIHKILDSQPAVRDTEESKPLDPRELRGKLEIKEIHFFYTSRPAATIFSDLSVTIDAGRSLAFVGESGSGKSTIISLLARFYDPIKGSILLDGQNIKKLTLNSLRGCIGLVGQEPALFATSIIENLRLGRPEATKEECIQAAKVANAHDFITLLPDGYNTHVGDRGTQLSGGQKQRIAIARAVLKNPSILLLDEATSALDAESERAVQAALDSLMLGRTSVVVAHRLSTINNVDTIAVLADGKLVEQGRLSDLMSKSERGKFFQLKRNQETKEPPTVKLQPRSPEINSGSTTPLPTSPNSEIAYGLGRSLAGVPASHFMFECSPSSVEWTPEFGTKRSPATKLPEIVEAGDNTKNNCACTLSCLLCHKATANITDAKDGHNHVKEFKDVSAVATLSPFGVFKEIIRLTVPEWNRVLLGWFGSISNGAVKPALAFLLIRASLAFFMGDSMETTLKRVHVFCIVFVLLGVCATFSATLEHSQLVLVGEKITKAIRERIFAATLRNEVGWYDRNENTSAMITERLAVDGAAINMAVSSLTSSFLNNISALLFAFGIGLVLEWRMTLVNATLIPMYVYSGYLRYKVNMGFADVTRASNGEVTQLATESVSNIRTVYAFTMEERVCGHLTSLSEVLLRKAVDRAIRAGLANGTVTFLPILGYSICILYIWAGLRNHTLSFANAFSVFQIMSLTAISLSELVILLPSLPKVVNAVNSITAILNRQSEIYTDEPDGIQFNDLKGFIYLKDVQFRYPSRPEVLVLNNVNLYINAGQTVALVGESGSGKSSIVALIERFYNPTAGRILIDNFDIRKLNLKWLRERVGLVQQEPALFNQTIRDNILYGKEEASEAEMIEAAKAANAHMFISSLPQGYDTIVGDRGTQLSGGQKQRVAIARAILKNPSILLLDEATSALDTISEKTVQEALDKLLQSGSRTTLIVAHRLSTIQNANLIVVMSKGQIVEQGDHNSLVHRGGFYARLLATHKK